MNPSIRTFATGCLALLGLGSCTLQPVAPLQLVLKLPSEQVVKTAAGGRGPTLPNMKCYGLIVKGGTDTGVTSSQVLNRAPSCLKMNGVFNGPYTYTQLTSGVTVPLTAGTYTLQLVGYHSIPDCGTGLSTIFSGTPLPEVYDVAVSSSFTFPATTKVVIDGSTYAGAGASEIFTTCPDQTATCQGYPVCDTFDDTPGTPLGFHTLNTGQVWATITDFLAPQIESGLGFGTLYANPNDTSGNLWAKMLLGTGTSNVQVRAEITPGSYSGYTRFGVIGRYVDAQNYTYAYFIYSPPNGCGGGLQQIVAGSIQDINSGSTPCDAFGNGPTEFKEIILNLNGIAGVATLGTAGDFTGSVQATAGTGAGVMTLAQGSAISPIRVKTFRARAAVRD